MERMTELPDGHCVELRPQSASDRRRSDHATAGQVDDCRHRSSLTPEVVREPTAALLTIGKERARIEERKATHPSSFSRPRPRSLFDRHEHSLDNVATHTESARSRIALRRSTRPPGA
jgi:hypothetical protein